MSRQVINLADGELWLEQQFLSPESAARLQQRLLNDVDWRQDSILLYGRQHRIPRLQSFMADPGVQYSYSGKTLTTSAWHPAILSLREQLQEQTGHHFNSVLLNLYRDGNDSMGWHSDDEPELGRQPVIASLSLGAERRLLFRRKQRQKGDRSLGLNLSSGSLLWMAENLQHVWQHSLPKTTACNTARINLTFRKIIPR